MAGRSPALFFASLPNREGPSFRALRRRARATFVIRSTSPDRIAPAASPAASRKAAGNLDAIPMCCASRPSLGRSDTFIDQEDSAIRSRKISLSETRTAPSSRSARAAASATMRENGGGPASREAASAARPATGGSDAENGSCLARAGRASWRGRNGGGGNPGGRRPPPKPINAGRGGGGPRGEQETPRPP